MGRGPARRAPGNTPSLARAAAGYAAGSVAGRDFVTTAATTSQNSFMKRNLQFLLGASAVSFAAMTAHAQNQPSTPAERADFLRDGTPHSRRTDRLNGAAKSSELLGLEVRNYQDEKLGKVEDLAIDLESGRIVQVIVSTGGFIGIGDTLTAVPPGALHHDAVKKVLHLNADKAKLKSAPKFEMTKWAESSDATQLGAVYRLYGEDSDFTTAPGIDPAAAAQKKMEQTTDRVSTRTADATWEQNRPARERLWVIPAARLGQLAKASKLTGTAVKNLQGEKLGDVNNLLLDLTSGRVIAVVVTSGGFLGLGDELSAVPPSALTFTTDRSALELNTTKEALAAAPHFKANDWPDFAQSSYTGGIYRAFNVEPYFAPNATTEIDNAASGLRAPGERALTPFDQGNGKADLATTAQIRQEIIADKDMSVNARNVKIITLNGRVTLRGPVNTADEKRLIGEIADRIAQAVNVDNQLEVKAATTVSGL